MTESLPQRDPEIERVRDEVSARLRARGIRTTHHDSPEDLARLLEAVEEFERTVERKGGDLMVDEPVGSRRPAEPDDRSFVLPARGDQEPVAAFIERIEAARERAARARRQS
jgi:hypothetical protein